MCLRDGGGRVSNEWEKMFPGAGNKRKPMDIARAITCAASGGRDRGKRKISGFHVALNPLPLVA